MGGRLPPDVQPGMGTKKLDHGRSGRTLRFSHKINQVPPSEAASQGKDFSSLIDRGRVLGRKLATPGLEAGSSDPNKGERSSGRV
eukprot:2014142-Pyramimonas_sp.AAC.1